MTEKEYYAQKVISRDIPMAFGLPHIGAGITGENLSQEQKKDIDKANQFLED